MSHSEKKPPSYLEVKCKECGKTIQRRQLENHYKTFHDELDYKDSLVAPKGNLHNFLKRQSSSELPSTSSSIKKQSLVRESTEKTSESVVITELSEQSSSSLNELKIDISKIKEDQGKILELLSSEKKQSEIKEEPNQSFDSTLKYCKSNDDILSNIDWIVVADDSTELVRCLVCTTGNVKKGMPGTFSLTQELRKLKFTIKEHMKRELHLKNLAESNLNTAESLKAAKRSDVVGMRLGLIAYQIIYRGEALFSYPPKIANLSLSNVDVGTTNHSKRFIVDLVPCLQAAIEKKMQEQINAPLPCTGEQPPYVLIDDKVHHKSEERHGIMLRLAVLKNGYLFKTFFLGHPQQPVGTRIEMTKTLFDTTEEKTNQTMLDVRQRLVGHTADGGIIKNLHIHVSHKDRLNVSEEYAKSLLFRDAAHLLESTLGDVKKVTPWLQKIFDFLTTAMVHFRVGSAQETLKAECEKLQCPFYTFHLFSTTRFHEYVYRSVKNFDHMWMPMMMILKRISSTVSSEGVEAQKGIIKQLQDPQFIIELLFVSEVSKQFSILSQLFQEENKFPFHVKKSSETVYNNMRHAKDNFQKNLLPKENEDNDNWKQFNSAIQEIKKDGTYKSVKLISKGTQGFTRASSSTSELDIEDQITLCFKKFSTYLQTLLDCTDPEKFWGRFAWPEWLLLSETCFDFLLDIAEDVREESFKDLLEIQFSPHPLKEDEKERLKEEYKTLCLIAKDMNEKQRFKSIEEFWYDLLTSENLFKHIRFLINYALRPLSRTYNETILESMFSKVKDTDGVGKPLNYETAEQLCFIRYNGPNPLRAKGLVRAALDKKFKGKEWHFVTDSKQFFVSKNIQHQIQEAKEEFSLFD